MGGLGSEELLHRDAVHVGEGEQVLQAGPPVARLQAGEGADRDATALGQSCQGELGPLPEPPQARTEVPERTLDVHANSLPDQQGLLLRSREGRILAP